MEKKIVKFALQPKEVKIKEILSEDFLKITVRCISDINPNRNMSHFTLEAMEKAVAKNNFYNKPILGHFIKDEDDFGGHDDGGLNYDAQLDELYYSYDEPDCERPLGTIRESDPVRIIWDENEQVHWIEYEAVIWTKYSFRAVKRLLTSKSKKKKISVEVEVLDSIIREDGVEDILEFNYLGTTILSDKLTTGIQNAELTLLDTIETAIFKQQQKALAFAYKDLDKQIIDELSVKQNSYIQSPTGAVSYQKAKEGEQILDPETLETFENVEEACNLAECSVMNCEAQPEAQPEEECNFEDCNPSECEKNVCEADSQISEPEEECNFEDCNPSECETINCAEEPKEECPPEECEVRCAEEPEAPESEDECNFEVCEKCSTEEETCYEERFMEIDGEQVNFDTLAQKYEELQKKYSALYESTKAQEVERLSNFGINMINAEDNLEDSVKADYIAQVTQSCEKFELTSEEEVKKFTKTLLAIYYYDNRPEPTKESKEFSAPLQEEKFEVVPKTSKLKDAISKLNKIN